VIEARRQGRFAVHGDRGGRVEDLGARWGDERER
jgi:hypothetical protein